MDSNQLKYITYLTQTTSLSKVAEHFFTSHQVVKKAIANLEEELHVSLVQSTNQGTQLTPAGLCVAKHALKFKQQYLELSDALQAFQCTHTTAQTELHLYVVPSMANDYYFDLFDSFFDQYPQIKLILHVSTFPQMLQDTPPDKNTIYLSMISSEKEILAELDTISKKYSLKSILLPPTTTYVCMHKKSPYAKLSHPTLEDLKGAPIYVFLNTNPFCFADENPGPTIQYFSDYTILKRNIKNNQALGILKKNDFDFYFGKNNTEFILRPLNTVKMQYTILFSEKSFNSNQETREFIEFLQHKLQE